MSFTAILATISAIFDWAKLIAAFKAGEVMPFAKFAIQIIVTGLLFELMAGPAERFYKKRG